MGGPAPIPIDKIWQWNDRNQGPDWFPDAIMSIDAKFMEQFNG